MVTQIEREDLLQLVESAEQFLDERNYVQVEKILREMGKILRWKG